MISKEEIRGLAELARLKLTAQDEESLQKDISSILDYVAQIGKADVGGRGAEKQLHNVMREDVLYENTLVSGKREVLLAALPKREGDYAVVRKIIQKDES